MCGDSILDCSEFKQNDNFVAKIIRTRICLRASQTKCLYYWCGFGCFFFVRFFFSCLSFLTLFYIRSIVSCFFFHCTRYFLILWISRPLWGRYFHCCTVRQVHWDFPMWKRRLLVCCASSSDTGTVGSHKLPNDDTSVVCALFFLPSDSNIFEIEQLIILKSTFVSPFATCFVLLFFVCHPFFSVSPNQTEIKQQQQKQRPKQRRNIYGDCCFCCVLFHL